MHEWYCTNAYVQNVWADNAAKAKLELLRLYGELYTISGGVFVFKVKRVR
jgi:hypothetical protein